MKTPAIALIPNRSLIRIGGPDRHAFLQNIVSNDVSKATAEKAIYAALLTPQGKFLHDMFILDDGTDFLIDCEAARAEDLIQRLQTYKLRSKVTFADASPSFDIWAVWGGPFTAPLSFIDPRLTEIGKRVFMPKGQRPDGNVILSDYNAYDLHRVTLGVADGSRDMEIEKSTLAEGNFDYLNGVDWKKGCYIGQELTARMYYRGLAKRRLFPVRIEGPSLPHGTLLPAELGQMRSQNGERGLALLKIEEAQQATDEQKPLSCGETSLWPILPLWMQIDVIDVNR